MKFICSSSTILKHLQNAGSVINSNNPLEILGDVLLRLTPGELLITASDLETTITTKIAVESSDSGSLSIPSKILIDSLKTFPEQPLIFTLNTTDFVLEISSDNGKYKIQGHNSEDYPKISDETGDDSVEIASEVLVEAINKTIFATGNDDMRPIMSCVLCQLSPSSVTFVATDAHKLVRYRRTDMGSTAEAALILPKKPLNVVKNILGSSQTRVNIGFNNQNGIFKFENYTINCRLMDGKYPNYEAVIPADNPNKLQIDRLIFLNTIKRVSVFASKSTNQIKLKIVGNQIQISAEDVDQASSANEVLACQYNGSDLEIGFNSRYLVEMLSNLSSEEINMEMSAPNRAGIILPGNASNEMEQILMLVMPVMLNN